MLTALAALLVTIGVLLLALRFLGRLQGVGTAGNPTEMVEILARAATGPRQGVVLLRVADRVLIVGVGQDLTLLGELDGTARGDLLARARSATSPSSSWWARFGLTVLLMVGAGIAEAQVATPQVPPIEVRAPDAPTVEMRLQSGSEALEVSGAVGLVVMIAALTLVPAIILLTTSFTRILIVLSFLRSALGTQSAPPTQLLVAMALLLTMLVMRPVLVEANDAALQPYLRGEIGQLAAYEAAVVPVRRFMVANTRDQDIRTFVDLAREDEAPSLDAVATTTLVTAFVTSELRTAFQMGFVLFLPFLVIDLIVASVLMSMGMFMLPPVTVAMPFKLLLFVLADGWSLVMQGLVASFRGGL